MELLWFVATKYSELNPPALLEDCTIGDYAQKLREINARIDATMRAMDELGADFKDAQIIGSLRKCVAKTLHSVRAMDVASDKIHAEFMREFRENIAFPNDDSGAIAAAFCDVLDYVLQRSEMMYVSIA